MHATLSHTDAQPFIRDVYRQRGDEGGHYRVWTEGPMLRVEARGHWDLPTADAYARDLRRVVGELRAIRPGLRAIVDRRGMPSFAPGAHEALQELYHDIQQPGDRIAMVVDSSLTKGVLRQIVGREDTQSFLSISAARIWVLAYG